MVLISNILKTTYFVKYTKEQEQNISCSIYKCKCTNNQIHTIYCKYYTRYKLQSSTFY